jgi:dienelactone hydrolase
MYSRLTDHWASRGYVVLQPTHRDSASLGFQTEGRGLEQMLGVIRSRILDMRFVLDSLDAIESRIPALKGRIDREKIVAAGHSMGGFTAMSVAGLRLRDPRSGAVLAFEEPRYDALLLIGDPGNMALLPDEPWGTIAKPTFVATGTNDFSEMAKGRVRLPFRYELADGRSATPHHHLFIRGMDHYLGGLICRTDVPGPPDLAALDAIQTASTAFLDTYLKGRTESTAFLSRKSGPDFANGRATLTTR